MANDLDLDLKQLTRIFCEGEMVDGARVHWDDDGVLNNIVEALAALDNDALEALARDAGIDPREAQASSEQLCSQLRADDRVLADATGTDGSECTFSTWIDPIRRAWRAYCVDTANFSVVNVSSSAGVYAPSGVNTLAGGAYIGPTAPATGAPPSAGVYAFRGVDTDHAVCFSVPAAPAPSANPEFSLAGHVFNAVCRHLRKEQEQTSLEKYIEASLQEQPDDEDTEVCWGSLDVEGVPARFVTPMSGFDQLIAVSHRRNGARSNRRDHD